MHMGNDDFSVRFWGVRGSLPCPGDDYARFGGNTPCLEIRCGENVLVFDAGSGLWPLGRSLANGEQSDLHLFFSHCHYDHICGLPFFSPLFNPTAAVTIWSGHHEDGMTTHDMVKQFMQAPFFPVGPEVFKSRVEYRDFSAGAVLEPHEGVRIATAPLNHPNGCIGYRVEYGDRAICYVSDTEHETGKTDDNVVALIANADIVIYDAAYTNDEFGEFEGFGHSTWEEGARLCDIAGADRLVVFHHCPSHDDDFMTALDDRVTAARPGALVAREGQMLSV